jgi:hypothetical protein
MALKMVTMADPASAAGDESTMRPLSMVIRSMAVVLSGILGIALTGFFIAVQLIHPNFSQMLPVHPAWLARALRGLLSTFGSIIWAAAFVGDFFALKVAASGAGLWGDIRHRQARLAQIRADTLPERTKVAARKLREATTVVEELQSELDARIALLEGIRFQVAEATERAADMEKLSYIDDETTRALNKYFDVALKDRLEALEQGARRREWLIGTVVAVAAGIITILVSHFLFGF